MTNVDAAVFRQLCGRFATGVVIVTTLAEDESPAGMTANSFTSLSLDPPLVSVSVDHRADMHRHLARASRFAINVLERRQEALSRRFAADHPDRFGGVGYHPGTGGVPLLEGVLATIECESHARFEAGDHTIFVGRVVGGDTSEGHPLLYYRGGYYDVPPA
jgi:flavin reductase (DIM6/NTAB) family NADH-FMN oxidoreductase RutF